MLKFRKKFLWELLALEYIICMGLLRSYVGYNNIWRIQLIVIFLALFLSKEVYRKILLDFYLVPPFLGIVIFIGVISIMLSSNNHYLFQNIAKWAEVQFILCLVVMLASNEKFNIRKVMIDNFYFLNFFWIINLVVLAIQCTGTGFMIKKEWLELNGFYLDHCSGLFGGSGTHKLNFFAIFMMTYNLYAADGAKTKFRKRTIYIFTFFMQFWMLYLSSKNDNKTVFFLIPIFLIAYYALQNMEKINDIKEALLKSGKIIGIFIVVIIITVVILSNVAEIKDYFNETVLQAAIKLATQGKKGSSGSIERITIATDALSQSRGWLFGDGLGAAALSEGISGHYRGYIHFSMSSIGTLITLGGVWFYILYCLIFTKAFSIFLNNKKRFILCDLTCFILLVGLSVYTPIFETVVNMLWLSLIFVMCGKEQKV